MTQDIGRIEKPIVTRFYRAESDKFEHCFYVETSSELGNDEIKILTWLFAETFKSNSFKKTSNLEGLGDIVELGPRLNFETAFSSNAVAICHTCGLTKVTRIERSRRYLLSLNQDKSKFITKNHDVMTECEYITPLTSFETGIQAKEVFLVQIIEQGEEALRKINREMGLGMDEWDIAFYYDMFVKYFKRNPTNIECFQLGQANSEHCRHWFFKGQIEINGKIMPETLFEIIISTLKTSADNSVIAFKDNSSAIRGYNVKTIIPSKPGKCSKFKTEEIVYHPIFTAETHNFPSGVAPFPGAETGTGGRIRDVQATGKGSLVIAGTAGYCVGSLNIPDYHISGETEFKYPSNLASPIDILIEESNGASDYGNKFGEPLIQGFVRTFDLRLPWGERRSWIKPIMFTGGVGQIDSRHTKKDKPEIKMKIVQIGGPAYRIGVGGGAASSMIQGENLAELDFNAVQRGNGEMEQKMNRVIRACVEMGDNNPIISTHDQGAGGPCNVLTELIEPIGGKVEIRNIMVGDKTMSVFEIWGAEYQERNACLINPERLNEFQEICEREKVNCEILGEITGDGKIVVHDSINDSTPVNLELEKILGKMPQKKFSFNKINKETKALDLPTELTIRDAIQKVFSLPSVGSKEYLVHKVDRTVSGLVARQQCCGPLGLPVSDVAVVAQSHFQTTGVATSIGEQPLKMLVDNTAGAKMAVAEMVTNMVWARISDLSDIKCSVNWMWAAKVDDEGANMYDAAVSLRDIMASLGIAVDGGKDSLSMAAKVDDETVKAPGELVISGYATMPDIRKVITPDIKMPGTSELIFIDLANGKRRLGGSALAQVFGQVGSDTPSVEDETLLKKVFLTIQEMIDNDLILSGHDISDGGLITTISEMIMSGNCGAKINLLENNDIIESLFAEELGFVIEVDKRKLNELVKKLKDSDIPYQHIGSTTTDKQLIISQGEESKLDITTKELLVWWQATSKRLEKFQTKHELAEEQLNKHILSNPKYSLSFIPNDTPDHLLNRNNKPKVAVIREEGSNGDREMTSAFYMAGFEPWDVTITDLLNSKVSLADFRGIVFVGGFSYADVLDSAKGWAGAIKFNKKLKEMFDSFYNRKDTFSLGVCNGCQLMALLGWVPSKDILPEKQPRFIKNKSEKFESRWVNVKIQESPAIMFKDMAGSVLGTWVAHGEGRLYFPDKDVMNQLADQKSVAVTYVDNNGKSTEAYPFNPNGSPMGITGICSPNGRHLAMMPHPERSFLKWQWQWMNQDWKQNLKTSPWLKMFQNAREWCDLNERKKITYEESGVDIAAGNKAVDLIKDKVQQTFQYYNGEILTKLGNFSGIVKLKDNRVMGLANDGVGTKLMLAIILNKHDTVGIDLVAMCVNDLAVSGIMPELFLDYIAMGKQTPERTQLIIDGIIKGCDTAECALIGGEMAEMPGMYKENDYDLAGFAVGFADSQEHLILGNNIKPGMKVYGFPSSGIHSNGYSLVRKVLKIDLDNVEGTIKILNTKFIDTETTIGDELLKPTIIYVKTIKDLIAKYQIKGMVHVTGGGLIENPIRILPDNCDIEINRDAWEMPNIFKYIQQKGNIADEDMLKTFNCGIGLIVISPDDIDNGILIGRIIEGNKKVHII